MLSFFRRASQKKGLPAGTTVYVGEQAPLKTDITYVEFDEQKQAISTALSADNIQGKIQELPQKGGWLHVTGLENTKAISEICEALGVHALIIEDILHTDQLVKIDFTPSYVFLVIKTPKINNPIEPIEFDQLSIIMKDNLIVSFLESQTPLIEQTSNYIQHFTTKPLTLDNNYLLYFLIDMIIDDHLALVEQKGDILEEIEESIIQQSENIESTTLYLLKRDMLHLRKNIMGLNNMVNIIMNEHRTFLSSLPMIYLRDLHDHLKRIMESIDLHRELSKNILDIYMSSLNTKINETMKFLAVFASIFIPLSFITSFYGMNFPQIFVFHWKYGYAFVLALMVVVTVSLFTYFRHKKWI